MEVSTEVGTAFGTVLVQASKPSGLFSSSRWLVSLIGKSGGPEFVSLKHLDISLVPIRFHLEMNEADESVKVLDGLALHLRLLFYYLHEN